jgi:hypothetical protein
MNNSFDEQYINRLFDEFQTEKAKLVLELKNDKELTKERIISNKMQCIDVMTRSILKYRNLIIREKMKTDI